MIGLTFRDLTFPGDIPGIGSLAGTLYYYVEWEGMEKSTITDAIAVRGSSYGSLFALRQDGTLVARGRNNFDQLGLGSSYDGVDPVTEWTVVPGLVNVVEVAPTTNMAVALCADGTVWVTGRSWSSPNPGAIGLGPGVEVDTFTQISGLSNAVQVSANELVGGVRLGDGTVWQWGSDAWVQIGPGGWVHSPYQADGISDAISFAVGPRGTSVVHSSGTMSSRGGNQGGGIGQPLNDYYTIWTAVPGVSDAIEVIAYVGSLGAAVIQHADGSWSATGDQWDGELGVGSWDTQYGYVPVTQAGLTRIRPHQGLSAAFDSAGQLYVSGEAWSLGSFDWENEYWQHSTIGSLDVSESLIDIAWADFALVAFVLAD